MQVYYTPTLHPLGSKLVEEDVTNRGRIDLTIFIKDKIYIIEFKVGNDDALMQIKNKGYAEKYKNRGKDIILVGINFDEEKKNVSMVRWEHILKKN